MTTPNIVPRGNGEGGIGTNEKFWKNGYFENLQTRGGAVATENHVQLSIKNHNDDIDAHSAAIGKHNSATSVHTANLASKAEAEAGTDTSKFMTPARVSDAIKTFAGADLTGMIFAFAGSTIPSGFLLCDGSKVSRTTYKKLFDVIGTTYGAGDGSTTFTLPNLIDRFLEGSSAAGKYRSAGLPNITGAFAKGAINDTGTSNGWAQPDSIGAFTAINVKNRYTFAVNDNIYNVGNGFAFDASKSNPIYGNSSTVQPASLSVQYCIKY